MNQTKEAINTISEYCKKNNYTKCYYNQTHNQTMTACTLLDTLPVYLYKEGKYEILKTTRTKEQKTNKI